MDVSVGQYIIQEESLLKGLILTHGVIFTNNALAFAQAVHAKRQNLVYNMPKGASKERPQELLLKNKNDGYETVVSCVSPTIQDSAVIIDYSDNGLSASINGRFINGVEISFVKEPDYYQKRLLSGKLVKQLITACGYDELNILPWKGCAISHTCKFCGANTFIDNACINAIMISKKPTLWDEYKATYLSELEEATKIAIQDECYQEHMHVILISGNLSNELLDLETIIFSEISQRIYPLIKENSTEGIVLVITPPSNTFLLRKLKSSGVSKVVFNFEAISRDGFREFCPGKNALGYDFFLERLYSSVSIWGKGNVWSNLVLGLEPNDVTLPLCQKMAENGIVFSANVLHIDQGNRLSCYPPSLEQVLEFYYNLELINQKQDFQPFYCSKALRTSLTNEAHANRFFRSTR